MAVDYERRGACAVLTINRPERRNAVDGATAKALLERYREFEADDAARVLILTGAGGEAFCAGADLKAIDNPAMAPEGPMGFTRLQSPKPTIAAVEGWCVAGGLEVACWCDMRVAGEGATFGVFNRRWGVPLIDGGTMRLPLIVGLGRALDIILTGRAVDAEEALAIGLANRVVPKGQALTVALELGERIAAFPWPSVLSDRASVFAIQGMEAQDALRKEAEIGRDVLRVGAEGAARFAAGEGRHGAGT